MFENTKYKKKKKEKIRETYKTIGIILSGIFADEFI